MVDVNLMQGDKAASRITDAGIAMIGGGNSVAAVVLLRLLGAVRLRSLSWKGVSTASASSWRRPSWRCAVAKYPFDQMEVGDTFVCAGF